MKNPFILLAVLLIIIGGVWVFNNKESTPAEVGTIRIGVLTDLTGPAAGYWGEPTRAGAELAAQELRDKGYDVQLFFEDYQLDASKAPGAIQKLISVDKVDAMYVEFNPGAIVAASIFKDRSIPMIYDAAITSPLKESEYFFKTYLDFQAGCRTIAQKFKDEGMKKIGMLKINLEAGELCFLGVKEVFGDEVVVEGYNMGDTDFRTQILKIKNSGVTAVINAAFEDGTYNTLKVIHDLGYNLKFGTVDDTITEKITSAYGKELKGAWTFGFRDVGDGFKSKVDALAKRSFGTYYGAAIAYTHVTQLAQALAVCDKETKCVTNKIANSTASSIIGFRGFENRIANLDMQTKQY